MLFLKQTAKDMITDCMYAWAGLCILCVHTARSGFPRMSSTLFVDTSHLKVIQSALSMFVLFYFQVSLYLYALAHCFIALYMPGVHGFKTLFFYNVMYGSMSLKSMSLGSHCLAQTRYSKNQYLKNATYRNIMPWAHDLNAMPWTHDFITLYTWDTWLINAMARVHYYYIMPGAIPGVHGYMLPGDHNYTLCLGSMTL